MPNNILIKYGSTTTITNAIASLASDTNLLAGYESAVIDNTTDGFDDIILSGKITTGTGLTAGTIQVLAVAWDSNGWPDCFDGTASAETISSAEIKGAICKTVQSLATTSTSNVAYFFTGVSARQVFGGSLPSKFVLFTTHNTVGALNATAGNHEFRYQGVYPQVQ